MKTVLISLLNIATVAGGVTIGGMIKPDASHAATEALTEEAKSADSHEGDGKASKTTPTDYYAIKFGRPFVIPIADGWRTQGLVVLDVNLEVDRSAADAIPGVHDKLRDRIMSALVAHSHGGGFDGGMTDPTVYEAVRLQIRDAAQGLIPDAVGDVLILEMVKRTV
jgi:hypothetical protein